MPGDARKVDIREQVIISVAMSVRDVKLIGVVKFYDRCDRLALSGAAKLDPGIDCSVNSLIGSVERRHAHDKNWHTRMDGAEVDGGRRIQADLLCPQSRVVPFLSSTTIVNFSESNLDHVCVCPAE